MKAVFIFCEGNHDITFVARSLGHVVGAQWVGKQIGELPSPLGPLRDPANPRSPKVQSVIVSRYSRRVLDQLSVRAAAHAPTPTFESIVQQGDIVYALIRTNGDSAAEAAIELVLDFMALLNPAFGNDITDFAAAFLFDADANHGAREAAFAREYAGLLGGSPAPAHGSWVKGLVPVGLYIFHKPTTRQGTVEDLLAPLVETEWGQRWQAADAYLAAHMEPTDPVAKKPGERLKAQITITGQFVCPGDPMTQVIGHNVLPSHHFGGAASKEVVSFLQQISW